VGDRVTRPGGGIELDHDHHPWAPTLAVAVGLIAIVLIAAGIPLTIAVHQSVWQALGNVPLMVPFAVVGFVVARRQPGNPIGWLMLAVAPVYMLGADAGLYAVLAYHFGHPALPLARLGVFLTGFWIILPIILPLPVLLFPDGRLPSGRWRWTVWAYVAAAAVLLIGVTATDIKAFTVSHVRVDNTGALVTTSGSGGQGVDVIGALMFVTYAAISLSWVIRQVLAYRGSTGERRQQMKWLLSGGAIGVVGFVFALLFNSNNNTFLRLLSLGFIGVIAVPISIGVGILKYRLYEIDRVISRTLSYAAITGLLIAVYVGMVALTTRALPLSSSVGVAASTLAAVALFTPLRRRVQRIVDRRFNRTRYDAEATVAAFTARLRDSVDLDTVRADLVDVVNRAVEATHVSVWVR
jgi:hypothetical protein